MAQPPPEKQPAEKQPYQPPPRRNWSAPVGNDATVAARTAFTRAGFTDPTLVLRWNEIAGAETARLARPIKLSSTGTLTLKAEPAAALFLQHETRALCARINGYLGRDAVTKLKFVQGPLVPTPPPPPRRARPTEPAATDPARRFVGPEGLGQALLALARQRTRPTVD